MMKRSVYPVAEARIRGDEEYPELSGTVRFYQRRDGVLVEARLSGLPQNQSGFFGFHIHEGSSCAGGGFPAAGSHYDPWGRPHPRHPGDLPPLLGDHGRAYARVLSDRFHTSQILGRTVIIHGGPDDLTTQPSGSSGMKIGCGVIRRIR